MTLKQRICLAVAAFIFINAFAAAVSWSSGFNFDHRDSYVAEMVFYTEGMSTAVALLIVFIK